MVANQVLRIPEMLESILVYLGAADILNVSVTFRGLKNIIHASPKLGQKLFLKPESPVKTGPQHFRTPFNKGVVRAFDVSISPCKPARESDLVAVVRLKNRHSSLPKIGLKCRSMLISQPPVSRMLVDFACTMHASARIVGSNEVVSETGITVGDLHDKASEILRDFPCRDCSVETGGTPAENVNDEALSDGMTNDVKHLIFFESFYHHSYVIDNGADK